GGEDPVIGCLFVRDVRFFPADAAAQPPARFRPNIVQGKSYDLADQSAAPYFRMLLQLLLGAVPARPAFLPGSGARCLSPPLRDQRNAHTTGASGGAYSSCH